MHIALTTLIDRLEQVCGKDTNVIPWGSPVPSFGDLSRSTVATLGINPSNREFVDDYGNELDGLFRRFHTLQSLGVRSWSEIDSNHLGLILGSCRDYFSGNPYDRWFKRLDQIIQGANVSYYGNSSACHLDLIPYATASKWTDLTSHQKTSLLAVAGDTLGLLLRDSPVKVLVLNGKSVVDHFQNICRVTLEKKNMPTWSLPRQNKSNVAGFSYKGTVSTLAEIGLGRDVLVVGYNHNIQSSFGVTSEVIRSIRDWFSRVVKESLE